MLGAAAGGLFGQPQIGAILGNAAESLVSHLFGSGDYVEAPFDVSNNTLTGASNVMSQQLPTFSGGGLMTRIQHREFIGDYGMSTPFAVTQFAVTPVNAYCFPWLSGIAFNFQKFKFKGLVFELRSTSANAVASTVAGMGSGFMMTNYDPVAPVPADKVDMLNAYFSCSAKPSESFYHPVECDPMSIPAAPLYILKGGAFPSDFHWYVMCTVNVGTQGAATPYGGAWELWVSYDVELYEPITPYVQPEVKQEKLVKSVGDVPVVWANQRISRIPTVDQGDDDCETVVHPGPSLQSLRLPSGPPSVVRGPRLF